MAHLDLATWRHREHRSDNYTVLRPSRHHLRSNVGTCLACTPNIVSFDRLSQYATPEPSNLDEIVGPSAYGAATIAGSDGSRQPVAADLSASKFQGKHFSTIVNAYVAGKAASGNQL